jgi:hypothetical protein
MYVFLVPYRARGVQSFRRDQIQAMIANVQTYFAKNRLDYKIIIAEQNNNEKFNRGFLLNTAFLEAQKLKFQDAKFLHFNVDYIFDLNREFPDEVRAFTNGFLDFHRPSCPVLGAACLFDGDSYKTINGFPNDLVGWGGDDWAIYNRIIQKQIPIHTPPGLFNSGFVVEMEIDRSIVDTTNNNTNMELSIRNDIDTNGLTTCVYAVEGFGEFHDQNNIFHMLIKII